MTSAACKASAAALRCGAADGGSVADRAGPIVRSPPGPRRWYARLCSPPDPGGRRTRGARARARAPPTREERHGVRTYTIRSQTPSVDSVQTVLIQWMRGTCAVHYMDSPPRITLCVVMTNETGNHSEASSSTNVPEEKGSLCEVCRMFSDDQRPAPSAAPPAAQRTSDVAGAWLLVTTQPPHLIVAVSPEWLQSAGYVESDVTGRSAALLHGSGTCLVTTGALWTAVQVRFAARTSNSCLAHQRSPQALCFLKPSHGSPTLSLCRACRSLTALRLVATLG